VYALPLAPGVRGLSRQTVRPVYRQQRREVAGLQLDRRGHGPGQRRRYVQTACRSFAVAPANPPRPAASLRPTATSNRDVAANDGAGQVRPPSGRDGTGGRVRDALDLEREPAPVRERYGKHLWCRQTLLARRL